jgi:serine/threonine-protein kinase RsbW
MRLMPRRGPDLATNRMLDYNEIAATVAATRRMNVAAHVRTAQLSLQATKDEVRRASAWLSVACSERGVPPSEIGRLDICLNEVLTNIIMHSGCNEQSPPVELSLEIQADLGIGKATVTVADAGHAFDPLAVPPNPQPRSLADAEPGGLGLVMIRSNADDLRYRHRDGRNEFSFAATWPRRSLYSRRPTSP